MILPGQIIAVRDRSDPLLGPMCYASLTVVDVMQVGLSPMVFTCNEGWTQIFDRLCPLYGYVYEWVSDELLQPRIGEAVLTKV
jgi:hypothetical protein